MTCTLWHLVFDPHAEFHSLGNTFFSAAFIFSVARGRIERQRAHLYQIQHRRISCTDEGRVMLQGR